MAKGPYFGTTASSLDHYFGNYAGMARLFHLDKPKPSPDAFEERKQKFIAGLERAIAQNLPEYGGITQQHLREMMQLAQGDWTDVRTVKALYARYDELRQGGRDIPALFGEK